MRVCHFGYQSCQLKLNIYFLAHGYEQNIFHKRPSPHVRCWSWWIRQDQTNFSMLASKTFRPSFNKTFYFYRKCQSSFSEMARKLNIELIPCLDFNMIKKLEDCLLVFDDSCVEIYQERVCETCSCRMSQKRSLHIRGT